MSPFLIAVILIAGGLVWLPLLLKIPFDRPVPSSASLPCRGCERRDVPTQFYAWTQWSRGGRRYRRDWLCQACAQQWQARPAEERRRTRDEVPS